MNQYRWLIAGPGFEGFGEEPAFRVMEGFVIVFFLACLYVAAKEFRLTMKHPPQPRDGLLYRVAVRIVATGFVLAAVCTICFVVVPTFVRELTF